MKRYTEKPTPIHNICADRRREKRERIPAAESAAAQCPLHRLHNF